MTGADSHKVIASPHDRLQQVMRKYNRMAEGNPKR
jgi:microcompartment protein CcmL/EutN